MTDDPSFDATRKTGQPVWPIEERPVPQSTVPGERTWPTQPFPTKPPPFDLQGSLEENLIEFTPELRKRALDQLQHFVHGPLYTPPSEMGTLVLPGNLGGANWGGAAFDPEAGILYIPSRTTPTLMRLTEGDPKLTNVLYRLGGGGTGLDPASMMTIEGLPLFKPPYARLTALDLNRGEHLWTAAVGNGPRNHPLLKDLNLPPLGDAVDGVSVLATKTLLFVTTWRRQRGDGLPLVPRWAPWGDPDAGRKLLYVFDKRSGALVREIEMDGFAAAAPMTYLHAGKQYLVMAVGGNEDAAIVAFGLPGTRRN